MKKNQLFILVIVIVTVFCGSPATQTSATETSVTVTVDPRIELLSIVQYLSDYTGFNGNRVLTKLEFPYKKKAIEHFTPYTNHKAVQFFDEMSANGFWYGQPPEAMLSYTDPPALKKVRPVSDFVIQRAGGKEKLDEFIERLRRFAVESNFMAFYSSHEKDYEKMISDFHKSMGEWNYVNDLKDFYGYSQNSYTIVVAPFFHKGGFGPSIEASNGRYDVYNLGGPWDYKDGTFYFGDGQYFRRLVWHEFSHSYVNHLTDLYIDRLTDPGDILNPGMKEKIAAMPNVTWNVFVHEWVSEHIVRAVTTSLAYTKLGKTEGDKALQLEEKRGYPYVKQLCNKLELYMNDRSHYKTFPDFFPELVKVFEDIAEKKSNETV